MCNVHCGLAKSRRFWVSRFPPQGLNSWGLGFLMYLCTGSIHMNKKRRLKHLPVDGDDGLIPTTLSQGSFYF